MIDSTFSERLVTRAAAFGISLTDSEVISLRTYCELLEKWNRRMNLTSLRLDDWPDATLDRLLLEPLVARPFAMGLSGEWVDFGSGGGSPAIPLAVVTRGLHLTLTESKGRKAAFLREVLRALELTGANVVGRFEELSAWPAGSVALLTSRAVKREDIAELSSTLLAPVGRLLLFDSVAAESVGSLRAVESIALPGNSSVLTVLQVSPGSTSISG